MIAPKWALFYLSGLKNCTYLSSYDFSMIMEDKNGLSEAVRWENFFGKNLLSWIGTFPTEVGRFMESSIVAKDWCPFDAIQCSYWGKFLAVFKFVVDTRFQLERKSSLKMIWRSHNNSLKLDFMEWTKNERGPHHQTWNELLSIDFHWKIINRKIEHSQIFPLLGAPTASLRKKPIGSIGRNVSQSGMAGQEERLRVHGCFLSAIYWIF